VACGAGPIPTLMTTLPLIDPSTAAKPVADLLAAVQRTLGATPNTTKAMANGPALLSGYLALSGALGKGVLTGAVREQIALAVSQDNACSYCLSAHSYLAVEKQRTLHTVVRATLHKPAEIAEPCKVDCGPPRPTSRPLSHPNPKSPAKHDGNAAHHLTQQTPSRPMQHPG